MCLIHTTGPISEKVGIAMNEDHKDAVVARDHFILLHLVSKESRGHEIRGIIIGRRNDTRRGNMCCGS